MSIGTVLKSQDPSDYGPEYRSHCLEMYRIYSEITDNVSNRRQSANTFFLTINTAIIGAVGWLDGRSVSWDWAISLAAMLICYTWYRLVRSYRDLNSAKFKVLHEMEKELPFSPFDAEWEAVGRGKDASRYLPFTRIETRVPVFFGVAHFIVFCAIFPWCSVFAKYCA